MEKPLKGEDIYDGLANGSGVKQVLVGEMLNLTCVASISNFTSEINWLDSSSPNLTDKVKIEKFKTSKLYVTILRISQVEKSDQRVYTCDLVRKDGINHIRANYTITVHEPKIPFFENTNMFGGQSNFAINAKGNPLRIIFKCYADGMPKPVMSWEKDGMKMLLSTTPQTSLCNAQFFNESRELHIDPSDSKCSGEYQCQAENYLARIRRNQTIKIEKLSDYPVGGKPNQTIDNDKNENSNNDIASVDQPSVNNSNTRTELLLIVILIIIAFLFVLIYYCTVGKKHLKRKVINEEKTPPSFNGDSVDPPNLAKQVIEEETAPRIPNEVSVGSLNLAEQVIGEETAPQILEEVSVGPSNPAEQVIEKEEAPPFLKRISAGLQHPGDLVYQDNHILSYNRDKWEYPFEKLILRNDLAEGYFGFVMKATAPNILGDGNDRTRVAAKGIKPDSKFSESRAITIEVRILANLGKHPNIVDFLGACTENVPYRTIYVLLEYCRLGSLSAYIKKHKSKFTNKIEIMICGKKDPSLGKFNEDIEEVADELESAGNTVRSSEPFAVFDADGNLRTPDLSPISYNSDDFMRHGGINPRSNEPMPFSTGDLLTWSSQVAHGMEFLSEKKILHGDLAARNVLLSDNRTAKICDFGLARSMEFTGYYHSEISYHLPLLSSPIEAIESRLLSTKSDVWAFGILVWELLTLGERPYSTLYPMSKHFLLKFLKRGERLEKPSYATDRTYRMMRHCWEEEPSDRPSFSELIEELKNILDEKLTCE